MYKGTFLAIAEVVGPHLAAQASDWQGTQDGWRDSDEGSSVAKSARPLADDSCSRHYPWPLKAAGDRRCAD